MKTLELVQSGFLPIPISMSWQLTELGRLQGTQELYTRQSPQRLKALREHAIAQSAVASNRIEGVEIDQNRVGTVVFGHPSLRDRNEEEVTGYRDALNWIHEQTTDIPVVTDTILKLHRMMRGEIWDAGHYKDKPFRLKDIEALCPGVGRDWIRKILFDMKKNGQVTCEGKGKAARWRRIGQ